MEKNKRVGISTKMEQPARGAFMKGRIVISCAALLLFFSRESLVADDMDALAEEAVRMNPKLTVMERQAAALRFKSKAVQTRMDLQVAAEYSMSQTLMDDIRADFEDARLQAKQQHRYKDVARGSDHESVGVLPFWRCPRHRGVIRGGPGTCPKCGMKLVREK